MQKSIILAPASEAQKYFLNEVFRHTKRGRVSTHYLCCTWGFPRRGWHRKIRRKTSMVSWSSMRPAKSFFKKRFLAIALYGVPIPSKNCQSARLQSSPTPDSLIKLIIKKKPGYMTAILLSLKSSFYNWPVWRVSGLLMRHDIVYSLAKACCHQFCCVSLISSDRISSLIRTSLASFPNSVRRWCLGLPRNYPFLA